MSTIIVQPPPQIIYEDTRPNVEFIIGEGPPGISGVQTMVKHLREDYGAVGDGSHDDTAALLAAAADLTGGVGDVSQSSGPAHTLYVPAGTFMWRGLVEWPRFVTIKGEGKGVSTFKAADSTAQMAFSHVGASGYTGFGLEHLTFHGNNVSAQPLLVFGRGSEGYVLDVQVLYSADYGVAYLEAQNITHINFSVSDNLGGGMFWDGGCGGLRFFGFEMTGNGGWAIKTGITDQAGRPGTEIQTILLDGGIIERSVAESLGFLWLGQGTNIALNNISWSDTSPEADLTYWKVFQERPRILDVDGVTVLDPGLTTTQIHFGGTHRINGAGAASGFGTWLDLSGNVDISSSGEIYLANISKGLVWRGGPNFSIDWRASMNDLSDTTIVGTPFTDLSGTSTNLNAVLRAHSAILEQVLIYHEGGGRYFKQFLKHGDAQPMFAWRTDGKMYIGPGGSVFPDGTLYRDPATTKGLRTDAYWHPGDLDTIRGTSAGVSTTSNLPTPSAIYRGYIVSVYGNGSTVGDQQYVCRRLADGTYDWQALGTGIGTTGDAMTSTMVRVPFGATDYVAEVNGSATATYTASGATNLDGSGTSLALSVPADPTRTGKHATVWVPFRGTAFGVRWLRDLSATDRPDLSVVVDGVAFAVPTGAPRLAAEGLTGLVDEAEATVVTGLPDDQHLAQIVVPAQVAAQNITLLGLLLDARAGYEWGVAVG